MRLPQNWLPLHRGPPAQPSLTCPCTAAACADAGLPRSCGRARWPGRWQSPLAAPPTACAARRRLPAWQPAGRQQVVSVGKEDRRQGSGRLSGSRQVEESLSRPCRAPHVCKLHGAPTYSSSTAGQAACTACPLLTRLRSCASPFTSSTTCKLMVEVLSCAGCRST